MELCSTQRDEPLPGTAATEQLWVCLEHHSAWGRDILDGDCFGAEDTARLTAWLTRLGARLLLIRPFSQRYESGHRQVYVARSTVAGCELKATTVADLDGLLALGEDFDSIAAPSSDETIVLVCTHGKRDRCCALKGRPLANDLSCQCTAPGVRVWECSHTGGHRFAPSVILLPTGYTYGHLTLSQAQAAATAASREEVSTQGLRGRSCYRPAEQAAEVAVRQHLSAAPLPADLIVDCRDSLAGDPADGQSRHVTVTLSTGRSFAVTVTRTPLPPRAPSCGAELKPAKAFVIDAVTEVENPHTAQD